VQLSHLVQVGQLWHRHVLERFGGAMRAAFDDTPSGSRPEQAQAGQADGQVGAAAVGNLTGPEPSLLLAQLDAKT
jgi:hypothetical protein